MEPESFRIGPYEPSLPEPARNGSTNGHRRAPRARRAASHVWPVAAGALLTALIALAIVPRLHFLNLALFNPWPRPVIAAAVGGLAAGLIRGRRSGSGGGRRAYAVAGLAGILAGIAGLWLAALAVRAQVRVLFVDRSPVRVIAADLLRLAAYAIVPAASCAIAGAFGRTLAAGRRRPSRRASGKRRDETPITEP